MKGPLRMLPERTHEEQRMRRPRNPRSARRASDIILNIYRGDFADMAQSMVVTFDPDERGKSIIAETIAGAAEIVYIAGLDATARANALRTATVVLTRNTARELQRQELDLLRNVSLVQFVPAGIDFIPVGDLPPGVPVASNAGAYCRADGRARAGDGLAAAKRLLVEHAALTAGEFNQFEAEPHAGGSVCGIFGFGGIGEATARLMRCVGMRIHAINRRGATDEAVDWIGDAGPARCAAGRVRRAGDQRAADARYPRADRRARSWR